MTVDFVNLTTSHENTFGWIPSSKRGRYVNHFDALQRSCTEESNLVRLTIEEEHNGTNRLDHSSLIRKLSNSVQSVTGKTNREFWKDHVETGICLYRYERERSKIELILGIHGDLHPLSLKMRIRKIVGLGPSIQLENVTSCQLSNEMVGMRLIQSKRVNL